MKWYKVGIRQEGDGGGNVDPFHPDTSYDSLSVVADSEEDARNKAGAILAPPYSPGEALLESEDEDPIT